MNTKPEKKQSKLFITFFVLIVLIIGLHLFVPGFPGITAIAGTVFGFIIAGISVFCLSILLLFLFSGIGSFILGILLFVWTVIAIILFPILFPIFLPLFLIFIFISLIRGK